MPFIRRRWTTVVVAVALVLSMCSVASARTTTKPASGTPVVVGYVDMLTGAIAIPQIREMLEAYVADWNRRGGLNGRPIDLDVVDTGFDAAKQAAAIQQFVDEGAVAVLYSAGVCQATASLLTTAELPLFAVSHDSTCDQPGVRFSVATSAVTPAAAKYLIDEGGKKIAFVIPEYPGSETLYQEPFEAYIANSGKATSVVETTPLIATAADYDGVLANLKSQGVDSVFMIGATEGTALILEEAEIQGFGPNDGIHWLLGSSMYDPEIAASLPIVEGLEVFVNQYPWEEDNPAVRRGLKILERGGVSAQDGLAAGAYETAAMFERALRKVKGPVTRESVLDALNSIRRMRRVMAPYSVDIADPSDDPTGGVVLEVRDGKYVPISDFLIVEASTWASDQS